MWSSASQSNNWMHTPFIIGFDRAPHDVFQCTICKLARRMCTVPIEFWRLGGINERTNNIGMNLTLTSFSGWLNVSQNSKTGSTLSAEIPAILFAHTTVLCDPLYTSCIMYWKFWASRWKPQAKRRNRNEEDGGMARKKLGGRNREKKVGRREEILRWGELDMDLDGE